MNKGDVVYCCKTGKNVKIKDFVTVRIGDRDVFKLVTSDGERFYDEVMLLQRKSDTFWGRLFFGK